MDVYFRGIYLYPLTIGYGLLRQALTNEQRFGCSRVSVLLMSRRVKGSGHHEIRGCGANRWIDLKGHDCYRLGRTADRSAEHDCDLKQLWRKWSGNSCGPVAVKGALVFPGSPDDASQTIG